MATRNLLLAAVLLGASICGAAVAAADDPGRPPPDRLVAPAGADGYVWPYTSRSRSVEGRTLALNVVVRGDPARVRRAFVERSDERWSAVGRRARVNVSPWRPTHGSVRYTYVAAQRDAAGRWVPAAYQLAVGTYFGRRTHVRAYPGPTGDWTALQAHAEYWDWFRVRHTVTGVATAGRFVERHLRDEPVVERVTRSRHGHVGVGSDGWWTVVHLAAATALVVAAGPPVGEDLPLASGLVALPLGVRAWGLAAEAAFPGVTPKLFVAVGYPVLACGPPALVGRCARGRPAVRVAVLAAAGLGTGIALDAAAVGARPLPPALAGHRLALTASLAVLAFGAAREDRRVTVAGLAAWGGLLVAPLLGVA